MKPVAGTISSATAVLKLLELQQLDNMLLQSYAYAAQMRAVRAFAYYNMAMLWGRVLFLSDSSTGSYIDLLQSLQINFIDSSGTSPIFKIFTILPP